MLGPSGAAAVNLHGKGRKGVECTDILEKRSGGHIPKVMARTGLCEVSVAPTCSRL